MNSADSAPYSGFRFRTFLRKAALYTGLLAGSLVLLLAGFFYIFFIYHPALVNKILQEQLLAATSLPWRTHGDVRFTLSPLPGIVATDVYIPAASPEQALSSDSARPLAHVEKLRVYFDVTALLTGAVRLRLVELDTPSVSFAYDSESRPLWRAPAENRNGEGKENQSASALPEAAGGDPPLPAALAGHPLRDFARLLRAANQETAPSFILRQGTFTYHSVDNTSLFTFKNVEVRLDPESALNPLTFAATFSLPGADLEVAFKGFAGLADSPDLIKGGITGHIGMTPPGSRTVNGDFSSSFTWKENGTEIALPDFALVAETDALTANLKVDILAPLCTGDVLIHKLSLPRWFGFGRSLPAGLQEPLHTLVGEFFLHFDARGVEARNLRGMAGPLAVSGFVGTPDFSAPVVKVDLDLDRANLDRIFPFLASVGTYVPQPVSPAFTHLVLAPYPRDPAVKARPDNAADDLHIGYDIKIRVAEPEVHDVKGGPLEVLVFPVTLGKRAMARVAFAGEELLKGKVEGRLDIDEKNVLMHYDAKELHLALLPENKKFPVKLSGLISGACDIGIDVKGEHWSDDWSLKANAEISELGIAEDGKTNPWRLNAGSAKVRGIGGIYAVSSKGVRIDADWNAEFAKVSTSWNSKGRENLTGRFKGVLSWPPIPAAYAAPRTPRPKHERKGIETISGEVSAQGVFTAPLGPRLVPVRGKAGSLILWHPYESEVTFDKMVFEGMGSIGKGKMFIDASGKEPRVEASSEFKIATRELLKAWNMLPPPSMKMPELLVGKTQITGRPDFVLFEKIKVEADGAPITGEISWSGKDSAPVSQDKTEKRETVPGAANAWTFRLAAERLDIDKCFPSLTAPPDPQPASRNRWDLSSLRGLSLDVQLFLNKAKMHGLNFSHTKLTGTLQRDRFMFHGESDDLYGGTGTLLLQGTIIPEFSQIVLSKALAEMKGISLGRALYDLTKETSYGGTADVIIDLSCDMQCDADMPGKLSGIWSVNLTDGLYPSFFSSKKSNIRNTFSSASAKGVLDKGVVRWDNFSLQGPMVDMFGDGWLNLDSKTMDVKISMTLAKVPTIPVRFYGTMTNPHMNVRGVDMVLHTMQAAGNTVFGLLKGVLELPGRALAGIGDLFSDGNADVSDPGSPKAASQPAAAGPPAKPAGARSGAVKPPLSQPSRARPAATSSPGAEPTKKGPSRKTPRPLEGKE